MQTRFSKEVFLFSALHFVGSQCLTIGSILFRMDGMCARNPPWWIPQSSRYAWWLGTFQNGGGCYISFRQ